MGAMGIGKRIQVAMAQAGKRPVDIANHLGIKDAAVSQWFAKDTGPKSDRLPKLASFLGTTVDSLLIDHAQNVQPASPKNEVRVPEVALTLPSKDEMPRDIPILGTVSGGAGGLQMLNGEPLDWGRRPPRLKDRKDVFGVLVEEMSMLPRHAPGDLVYVERLRPPRVGDDVVVQLQDGPEAEHRAILKRLAKVTPTKITLEQFNPPKLIEVPRKNVVHLYRVMTMMDLLGV